MNLCVKECNICMNTKMVVVRCKWNPCTYQICRRCHFLYGRNKPCPACTKADAFNFMLVSEQRRMQCYHRIYKCLHYLLLGILPVLIIHIMAGCGVLLILLFYPESCCLSYHQFMFEGILAFILATLFLVCAIGCCAEGDDS